VYDGARADTADVVRVWLDRLGQPTRIRDPQFNETNVTRGDPRFPALVTEVDAPGGGAAAGSVQGVGPRRVSLAFFNARGGLDSTVVKSPLGDGRDAVSRYAYLDARWPDFSTRATGPTGLVSATGYDAAGNRAWQQVGADSTRRVRFGYDALGRVTWVQSQRAAAAHEQPEQVAYDGTLGNVSTVVSPLGVPATYVNDRLGRTVRTLGPIDQAQTAFVADSTVYDAGDRVLKSITTAPATSYESLQGTVVVPAQTLTVINTYDARHDLVAVSRAATPDPAGIDTVTTSYHYDALGRKVAEIAPDGAVDSTVYDLAGNATRAHTRRGFWIEMQYHGLNRLKQRITPAVAYADSAYAVIPNHGVPNRSTWHFPLFSGTLAGALTDTLSRTGLTIPADTARFAYDASGAVVLADNGDARVRRHYLPGGALAVDSLQVRNYADATFGHTYVITHAYDLGGRPVRTGNPAQLAAGDPAWGHVSYGYDAATGALASVADSLEGVAGFAYDADGRLLGTDLGSVSETQGYDADGRTSWERRVTNAGALLQRDTFAYDIRGKRTQVWSLADSTMNAYTAMGALAWSYTGKFSQKDSPEEQYSTDALANAYGTLHVNHNLTQDQETYSRSDTHFQQHTGRLLWEGRFESQLAQGQPENTTSSLYDAGGNRSLYVQYHGVSYEGVLAPAILQEITRSYFGADDKLRVTDRRSCVYGDMFGSSSGIGGVLGGTPQQAGCIPPEWTDRPTWEEYRYDALGRRVLTRSSQTAWSCEARCVSAVTRTVWDSDQIAAEIRAPMAVAEQDTGRVPVGTLFDHGYGQVLYTHGPSPDHPLKVTRLSYDSVFPHPIWVTPYTNWQGQYDSGEIYNSDGTGSCHKVSSGWYDNTPAASETPAYGYDQGPSPTHPDSVTLCVDIDWPAPYQWKSHLERGRGKIGPASWMGSLIEAGRDLTGQMYMRNRFYDPASGRFTQEDPIGIAGGLNVYGFGGGDPVTYSDPYGLCGSCGERGSVLEKFFAAKVYASRDAAAIAQMRVIEQPSVRENREYEGEILNIEGLWTVEGPRPFSATHGTVLWALPGYDGFFHSHGRELRGYDNENFSPDDPTEAGLDGDKGTADMTGKPAYLVTPRGVMKRYDPDPNKQGKGTVTILGRVQ
jgi:RHS repeat-associated protein